MPGRGVDLHPYYQRGTNALPDVTWGWVKAADGTAPYRKVADGRTWTPDAHAELFRRLGVPLGGYLFAQPGVDGSVGFDVLWAECQRIGATAVTPAIDIEGPGWNPTNATQRGRQFCARARARGVRPAVYMDLTLLRDCRPDRWPEDPVIWAPRYGAKPEQLVNNVQYLGRYDVHQYTSSGSLPGSAGAVDWNQAYTNAYLLGKDGSHVATLDGEDIANISKAVWNEATQNALDPGWSAARDIMRFGHYEAGKARRELNAKLDALLAKASGASADEVAAKLLPALTSAMATAVASIDVSQLDKLSDDDVSRIVDATVTHAGDLLSGRAS